MASVAGQGCGQPGCDGGWTDSVPWERAFEAAWPTVERRLRDILRARNVPAGDHEDYLQEVAARAVATQVTFHCAADLVPWAATVVRRLHIGQLRSGARQRRATNLTRLRNEPDTASAVVAKLDLDRVAETLASWPAFDRDMVLGGRGAGVTRTGPVDEAQGTGATYARRHRLRTKLLSVIDGVAGVFGSVRRFHHAHAPQLDQAAAALLTPAAVACLALVAPMGAVSQHDHDRPPLTRLDHVPAVVASTASSASGAKVGGTPDAGGGLRASRAASDVADRDASRRESSYRQVRSPVEHRVQVDAGEHDPYLEVENTDDEEGEYCVWIASDETCVAQPGGAIVSPVPLPL